MPEFTVTKHFGFREVKIGDEIIGFVTKSAVYNKGGYEGSTKWSILENVRMARVDMDRIMYVGDVATYETDEFGMRMHLKGIERKTWTERNADEKLHVSSADELHFQSSTMHTLRPSTASRGDSS